MEQQGRGRQLTTRAAVPTLMDSHFPATCLMSPYNSGRWGFAFILRLRKGHTAIQWGHQIVLCLPVQKATSAGSEGRRGSYHIHGCSYRKVGSVESRLVLDDTLVPEWWGRGPLRGAMPAWSPPLTIRVVPTVPHLFSVNLERSTLSWGPAIMSRVCPISVI